MKVLVKICRRVNAIDKGKIERLGELHGLIMASATKTIRAAIEAGEILVEIKAGLPHGEFTPWCEANLPFNTRTAQRYMRCHALRGRLLKNDSVTLLTGAYGLLTEGRTTDDTTVLVEKALGLLKEISRGLPADLKNPSLGVDYWTEFTRLAQAAIQHARSYALEAERQLGLRLNEIERLKKRAS